MKLLVVYHFLPHYRKGVIDELIQYFPSVHFAADVDSKIAPSIKTYTPPGKFTALKTKLLIGKLYILRGLSKLLIKGEKGHVIFLGDMNCLSVWLWGIIARLSGWEVSFWAHGWIRENEFIAKRIIRKMFFMIPNKLLLYGRRARKIAINQKFNAENVFVIYNSLDYRLQSKLSSLYNKHTAELALKKNIQRINLSKNRILCSSRLTYSKRFDLVISAISLIDKKQRPELIIIGEGPAKNQLIQQSKSLDVDTHFAGACYDESILCSYFTASDLLVSPGNVGLSSMHAMVYGLPVVTHSNRDYQMPEVESVIDDVTGFTFAMGDVNSLSQAIQRYFAKPISERDQMRINCKKIISKFFTPQNQVYKISQMISGEKECEPIADGINRSEIL